ncbi:MULTISPECIES: GntR family transcriptional regulator [unclassified Streptomyces]|uniref:GntR family transcriptional regulator n=1 Tax=unclassified Streptomyces TaxID=2593676 RepID=UPI00371D60CB
MTDMQVLRHAPIREQVANILRDAIVDQRLAPGQLLVERELCEMTSASRASVREALRQLQAEGLVESRNGRGTCVTVISPATALQVYQVRAPLEGLAARLFAENGSDEDRTAFREAVAELAAQTERGADAAVLLKAKSRAYDVLFRGCGNPVLHQTVQTLQHRVTRLRALTLAQEGRAQRSVVEVGAIVAAVDARDGAAAQAAATAHVEEAARVMMAAASDGPAAP